MAKTVLGNIVRADKAFNLFEDKDKICVGVSGGKDSMLLLEALNTYKKILKKTKNISIDVIGIHLKMNLCAIDYSEIENYWKSKKIDFRIIDTKMGEILRENMKKNKLQCSLCSKMKKAILIENAKKLNCNKVAMGHHADDAIETFFMNLINEGRIATFKPKMFLDRTDIWFIRPLILAREHDIIRESKKLKLPISPCGCPMEGFTQRDTIKEFLIQNFYKNPKWKLSYNNFLNALLNGKNCDLWFLNNESEKIDLISLIKRTESF